MVSSDSLSAIKFLLWSPSSTCRYFSVGVESGGKTMWFIGLNKPQPLPPYSSSVGNLISFLKSLQKGSKCWCIFLPWPYPLWIYNSHDSFLNSTPHKTACTHALTKFTCFFYVKILCILTSICLCFYRADLNCYNLPQIRSSWVSFCLTWGLVCLITNTILC